MTDTPRDRVQTLIDQWRAEASLGGSYERGKGRDEAMMKCADELAALLTEREPPTPDLTERLRELATEGAFELHDKYFEQFNTRDQHTQPFATCSHPDCLLVRAVPQAPEARIEELKRRVTAAGWPHSHGSLDVVYVGDVLDWLDELTEAALSPASSGEPVESLGLKSRVEFAIKVGTPNEYLLCALIAEIERLRGAVVPVERLGKEPT